MVKPIGSNRIADSLTSQEDIKATESAGKADEIQPKVSSESEQANAEMKTSSSTPSNVGAQNVAFQDLSATMRRDELLKESATERGDNAPNLFELDAIQSEVSRLEPAEKSHLFAAVKSQLDSKGLGLALENWNRQLKLDLEQTDSDVSLGSSDRISLLNEMAAKIVDLFVKQVGTAEVDTDFQDLHPGEIDPETEAVGPCSGVGPCSIVGPCD